MKQSIDGKVVIVTGASSGIGRAIARLFAAEGAKLALVARSTEKLEELAGEIGGDPLVLPIDLSLPAEVDRMAAATIAHFGHADVLMANAGIYVSGDAADGDPDAWENMISVNVNSVFRSVRAVLPGMIARRSGGIIVTSSIAGHQAMRGSRSTARPNTRCRRLFMASAVRSHTTTSASEQSLRGRCSMSCGA